ncbi:MAG: hypothetical protein KF745_03885 [Phycisphaeraceae bacterium]|nr:hypothetical protein [Phycisphaeraceae bacterium]
MQVTVTRQWYIVLAAYGAVGLLLRLAIFPVESYLHAHAMRTGIPVMLAVNLALPILIIMLAVYCPRFPVISAGAVLATLGWIIGGMLLRDWHISHWTTSLLRDSTHPILIPATLEYILVGATAAAVATEVRAGRVTANGGPTCPACGFPLERANAIRCPDCYAPIPPN